MSIYNNAADKAEKQLENISKTMCYAKWAQSSIHLTNGMTNSCYHPPLHKIDVKEVRLNPSALHNTKQKKLERNMMLQGERPEGCSYCWKIEDVGGRSDRIYRSGEEWAQNARTDIFDVLDTKDINPRYLEINFNQACNFKCMYCSPHLSTEWEKEVKLHGPFQVLDYDLSLQSHNDPKYLTMPLKVPNKENPYVEAFWRWWPNLYKKLEIFRMTGGEPLMDNNTFKVLDYIYTHPNRYLEISITSNLCPPKPEIMDKFIKKVQALEEIQIWEDPDRFNPGSGNHWYVNMALKNFFLYVSLDGVGKQAEYMRDGLDYDVLVNNSHKFLDGTCNSLFSFINTFNILSVPSLKKFLELVLSFREKYSKDNQGIKRIPIFDPNFTHPDHEVHPRQRVLFDIPVLRNPAWLNFQILPKEYEVYLEDAIKFMKDNSDVSNFVGFYDYEISKVERNLALMRERDKIDEHKLRVDRMNFAKFIQQYNLRRNLDFVTVFPELADFYLNSLKELK